MRRRPNLTPAQKAHIRASRATLTVTEIASRLDLDISTVSRLLSAGGRPPGKPAPKEPPRPAHWCTVHRDGYLCPFDGGLCAAGRRFKSSHGCVACIESAAAWARRHRLVPREVSSGA